MTTTGTERYLDSPTMDFGAIRDGSLDAPYEHGFNESETTTIPRMATTDETTMIPAISATERHESATPPVGPAKRWEVMWRDNRLFGYYRDATTGKPDDSYVVELDPETREVINVLTPQPSAVTDKDPDFEFSVGSKDGEFYVGAKGHKASVKEHARKVLTDESDEEILLRLRALLARQLGNGAATEVPGMEPHHALTPGSTPELSFATGHQQPSTPQTDIGIGGLTFGEAVEENGSHKSRRSVDIKKAGSALWHSRQLIARLAIGVTIFTLADVTYSATSGHNQLVDIHHLSNPVHAPLHDVGALCRLVSFGKVC